MEETVKFQCLLTLNISSKVIKVGKVQPENCSNDILKLILKYFNCIEFYLIVKRRLTAQDILSASLVCTHWYKISSSNSIWEKLLPIDFQATYRKLNVKKEEEEDAKFLRLINSPYVLW